MSCNYYLSGNKNSDDPEFHIGKRSAAGYYCWNCRKTLCMGGESKIHYTGHDWSETCLVCGAKKEKESLETSSAGRELGFNKNPSKRSGVRSVSSFTWAMPKEILTKKLKGKLWLFKPIEDEYGRKFTLKQFMKKLEDCPIEYYSINTWFC
uniref:Uncharacterized protein n=1 Tax=viral metagenome TaxID=1070528 RepID=A0A6H1ZCI3_9ZZZZ